MTVKLTNEDINKIVTYYQNGMSVKELGEMFGVHYQTISSRLKECGVFNPKTHNWTDEDTKKLLEVYPTGDWNLILSIFPNRNRSFLYTKASKLNIHIENYFWTEHDKNILIDLYGDLDVENIQKMLEREYPIKLIQNQAKKMGLAKPRVWTNNEINIMREKYESNGVSGVMNLLPGRSKPAIIHMAIKLGLRCDCFWSDDEKKFVMDNWKNMTDVELATALGRGVKGVSDQRRKLGLYYQLDYNGYYTLINYIRMNIVDWKKESMKASGYKCVVTGEVFDDIHHKYSFNSILKETLDLVNIDDRESIDDYTDDELKLILNTFKSIQSRYPLGACVTKKIHTLFHQTYGYGNNTPEQWDEFLENYKCNKYK